MSDAATDPAAMPEASSVGGSPKEPSGPLPATTAAPEAIAAATSSPPADSNTLTPESGSPSPSRAPARFADDAEVITAMLNDDNFRCGVVSGLPKECHADFAAAVVDVLQGGSPDAESLLSSLLMGEYDRSIQRREPHAFMRANGLVPTLFDAVCSSDVVPSTLLPCAQAIVADVVDPMQLEVKLPPSLESQPADAKSEVNLPEITLTSTVTMEPSVASVAVDDRGLTPPPETRSRSSSICEPETSDPDNASNHLSTSQQEHKDPKADLPQSPTASSRDALSKDDSGAQDGPSSLGSGGSFANFTLRDGCFARLASSDLDSGTFADTMRLVGGINSFANITPMLLGRAEEETEKKAEENSKEDATEATLSVVQRIIDMLQQSIQKWNPAIRKALATLLKTTESTPLVPVVPTGSTPATNGTPKTGSRRGSVSVNIPGGFGSSLADDPRMGGLSMGINMITTVVVLRVLSPAILHAFDELVDRLTEATREEATSSPKFQPAVSEGRRRVMFIVKVLQKISNGRCFDAPHEAHLAALNAGMSDMCGKMQSVLRELATEPTTTTTTTTKSPTLPKALSSNTSSFAGANSSSTSGSFTIAGADVPKNLTARTGATCTPIILEHLAGVVGAMNNWYPILNGFHELDVHRLLKTGVVRYQLYKMLVTGKEAEATAFWSGVSARTRSESMADSHSGSLPASRSGTIGEGSTVDEKKDKAGSSGRSRIWSVLKSKGNNTAPATHRDAAQDAARRVAWQELTAHGYYVFLNPHVMQFYHRFVSLVGTNPHGVAVFAVHGTLLAESYQEFTRTATTNRMVLKKLMPNYKSTIDDGDIVAHLCARLDAALIAGSSGAPTFGEVAPFVLLYLPSPVELKCPLGPNWLKNVVNSTVHPAVTAACRGVVVYQAPGTEKKGLISRLLGSRTAHEGELPSTNSPLPPGSEVPLHQCTTMKDACKVAGLPLKACLEGCSIHQWPVSLPDVVHWELSESEQPPITSGAETPQPKSGTNSKRGSANVTPETKNLSPPPNVLAKEVAGDFLMVDTWVADEAAFDTDGEPDKTAPWATPFAAGMLRYVLRMTQTPNMTNHAQYRLSCEVFSTLRSFSEHTLPANPTDVRIRLSTKSHGSIYGFINPHSNEEKLEYDAEAMSALPRMVQTKSGPSGDGATTSYVDQPQLGLAFVPIKNLLRLVLKQTAINCRKARVSPCAVAECVRQVQHQEFNGSFAIASLSTSPGSPGGMQRQASESAALDDQGNPILRLAAFEEELFSLLGSEGLAAVQLAFNALRMGYLLLCTRCYMNSNDPPARLKERVESAKKQLYFVFERFLLQPPKQRLLREAATADQVAPPEASKMKSQGSIPDLSSPQLTSFDPATKPDLSADVTEADLTACRLLAMTVLLKPMSHSELDQAIRALERHA